MMGRFITLVNGFQLLTIVAKLSILDFLGVVHALLQDNEVNIAVNLIFINKFLDLKKNLGLKEHLSRRKYVVNPFSANPIKCSNTLRQLVGNSRRTV